MKWIIIYGLVSLAFSIFVGVGLSRIPARRQNTDFYGKSTLTYRKSSDQQPR